MKKMITLLILICFTESSYGQKSETDLEGKWFGRLKFGAVNLRTGLDITRDNQGYRVEFFSLDQTPNPIPMEKVKYAGDILSFEKSSLQISYSGTLIENGQKLKGIFVQGVPIPLVLERVDKFPELLRPQTPKPPFAYASTEVEYINSKSGLKLSGTLTLARDGKRLPAAILITGSGRQDRNETIMGHKPFWVIADYLTRKGVAVLRVDDRAVGGSEAGNGNETSLDFATDVEAGIQFLRAHPQIHPKQVWLIGHSEGGYIAAMVAARDRKVSGVVSLAGPAVAGKDILIEQNRLLRATQGVAKETLDWFMPLYTELLDIALAQDDLEKARLESKAALDRRISSAPLVIRLTAGAALAQEVDAIAKQLHPDWMKFFLAHDPADDWRRTRCHVLAVFGGKDLQVSASQNAPVMESLLARRPRGKHAILEYKSLNHLLQHAETGNVSEYGTIEETIAEDVLEQMVQFILDQSR
tara:strand:+ start:186 stop:1598 length:1413 start_codon:yes stop_codon:yes gene_type:complete